MFLGFRFQGQVIFEKLALIKSWLIKSMSLFYINICFTSFINEGYFVDTRFCTHNLISENGQDDHLYTRKNHSCITCTNSFIAYHKNDLKVLTVVTICPISKSCHQIERYHMIKFAWSICNMFGWSQSRMINLN